MRTFPCLLAGLTILVVACSGGATSPSGAPTMAASPPPAAPPSSAASTAASGSPDAGAVDLPAACVESIRAFVVAIEPIVKDVQWATMTGTPPEIEAQLADVSETMDPDACPDLSVAEARDAWSAIAFEAAPGTLDYIGYVYRP